MVLSYFLLLHQFGIRTIIHHPGAKNGSGKRTVNFLGIGIFQFAIQDELVALGAQEDGGFLAQENKGKDIAVLRLPLAISVLGLG